MHKCNCCDKKFNNIRALNGHKSVHRPGGRYSKPRSASVEKACLQCGIKLTNRHSKYCSNKCQNDWQFYNIRVPLIIDGTFGKHLTSAVERLLNETYGRACSCCNLSLWQGKEIPLDIDHIDGDPSNNRFSNLRYLCANCHRLTDTWGMKAGKRELKLKGVHGRNVMGI